MSNDVLKHDLGLIEKGAEALRKDGHIFAARVLEVKLREFREQITQMDVAIATVNLYADKYKLPADFIEEVEDLKASVYVQFSQDCRITGALLSKFEDMVRWLEQHTQGGLGVVRPF